MYYDIPWSASDIGSSGSTMQEIAALLLSKTSSKIKNNLYFTKFKRLINSVWYNFSWVAIIGCLRIILNRNLFCQIIKIYNMTMYCTYRPQQ